MKVLFLNTYDNRGGAAVAAKRIARALSNKCMIYWGAILSEGENSKAILPYKRRLSKYIWLINLAIEKALFLPFEKSKKERFAYSTAPIGVNPNRLFKKINSDIFHIHWINQGFLSLKGLEKVLHSGKPVVWTLHDMWSFTGGCHYSGECENYKTHCMNCPMLKSPSNTDLSFKQIKTKEKIYKNANIKFVTCSNWLKQMAIQSKLLGNSQIDVIPNPINIDTFRPLDKMEVRKKYDLSEKKKFLLFSAGNIADPRKGIKYLEDALKQIASRNPQLADAIGLLLVGKNTTHIEQNMPIETHYLGYYSDIDQIVEIYNTADAFVLPSLEDNLPNTIMEALACGLPCIGFKTGGIPEMIIHQKTGYLANYKSVADLVSGIEWVNNQDTIKLSEAAREFAEKNYSMDVVGNLYFNLYNSFNQ